MDVCRTVSEINIDEVIDDVKRLVSLDASEINLKYITDNTIEGY